jgi:Pilus formation protein N terminal region
MHHGLTSTRFTIAATLALGQWTIAEAATSFKVVTAPNAVQQAEAAPSVAPRRDEPVPGAPAPGETETSGVTLSSPVTAQQILLGPSTARLVTFDQPLANIQISDPAVVDAAPVTDHSLVLKGLKPGYTDIYFFDHYGQLTSSLEVTVSSFIIKRRSAPDTQARAYKPIEVHNKAKLTSQTNFQCGPDGCHYDGELTVSEPAPLPAGYSNITNNIPSPGGGAQGAAGPTPTPVINLSPNR